MLNLCKNTNEEKINNDLSRILDGIDKAINLCDFKMLNVLENRWKEIRSTYSNDIINNEQLANKTLEVYRKLDNAKRQLVELRKQQKTEEFNNTL
jgi:hypothetical protein